MNSAVISPVEAHRRPTFLLAGWGIVPRLFTVCGILLILLFGAMVFAASTGPTTIPARDVTDSLLHYAGLDRGVDVNSATYRIVTVVRLPGLMVAALVGGALACAGAAMQGLFRNPLADPGIIGVSAGASFGVVLAVTQFATLSDTWLLTNSADFNSMRAVLAWLVGSLEGRGWDYFHVAKWPILVSTLLILFYSRDLNLMVIGEESAQSLGVNVPRTRLILLALSSLMTASAVSIGGAIGFVGLIVPHMLRLVIGPDHRVLLPASMIGGAAFLVFADALARSIIAPELLPVGTVTALVGGPFFIFLLWRNRRAIAVF
jgi:iron complex transport system permease protein